MTVHTPPPPTPPPPPPGTPMGAGQPPKKGLGVWAWVAIGCGVLLVLGLGTCVGVGMFVKDKVGAMAEDFEKNPAKAAAELAIKMNPEVEVVRSDDQTMTVRHKQTGEEVTVSFEDIAEGKLTWETKEGKATIDASTSSDGESGTLTVTGPKGEVATFGAGAGAASVPAWVPTYPGGEVTGNYDSRTPEGHIGAVTVTSGDALDEMMAFYQRELEGAGFEVQKTTMEGTVSGGTLTGSTSEPNRSVSIAFSVVDGKTQAMVSFSEAKTP